MKEFTSLKPKRTNITFYKMDESITSIVNDFFFPFLKYRGWVEP